MYPQMPVVRHFSLIGGEATKPKLFVGYLFLHKQSFFFGGGEYIGIWFRRGNISSAKDLGNQYLVSRDLFSVVQFTRVCQEHSKKSY